MSKVLIALLCITVFISGISLGLFFSINQEHEDENDNSKLVRQIQDIVMEQVQANQTEKYDVKETNSKDQIKISPYAKLIVEKYYKKCGHTTVDIIDVPKELINYTEDEFKKKYDKWEIRSFDTKEISIYREIDANCSSHYVIKENNGYLSVYNEITDDILELKENTDIDVASLRDEDRAIFENGFKIYGKSELLSFLEDFSS